MTKGAARRRPRVLLECVQATESSVGSSSFVPCFYAKGFDGRIDDPNAGWKGRGLWTTSGDRAPWLKEGGKGSRPIAVHFQLRPDPLAH